LAKFRQVHVEFWQDGFVLDLTPEEKYFYIYLMTNSKTSQCGIYELPKRIIETETGYNRETVDKLLQRFIDYGKILYDEFTKELMLVNWVKYNSIKSPKTMACIEKELKTIKNQQFLYTFYTLCKEYRYPIHTPYIDLGEEEEKEKEEEEEEEKESSNSSENQFSEIMNFYFDNLQKGISETPFNLELIEQWFREFGFELLLAAMKVAAKAEAKGVKFTEGVLKNWKEAGVKTIEDARKHEQAFKQSKQKPRGGYAKKAIRVEGDPDEIFAKQKEQQQKKSAQEISATKSEIDEMLKALEN
jgi:DnaD/phage-associated family protein